MKFIFRAHKTRVPGEHVNIRIHVQPDGESPGYAGSLKLRPEEWLMLSNLLSKHPKNFQVKEST